MVNRLNLCTSNLTATGTSSCTEFLSHPCQGRSNNERYQHSCYFINDHTYTILKKICRRMIKDYNRCQCREKYTIFDGGNSINVRIHRSTSRGDRRDYWCKNRRCHSASTEVRIRYDPSRTGQKFEPDDDKSNRCNFVGKSDYIDDESNCRKSQNGNNRDERRRYDDDRQNTAIGRTSKRTDKEDYIKDYNRGGSKFKSNGNKNGESSYYDDDVNYIDKRNKAKVNKRRDRDNDDRSDIDIMSGGKKGKGPKKSTKDDDRDNDRKGAKKRKKYNRKANDEGDDEEEGMAEKNRRGQRQNGKFKDADYDDKLTKGKKGRKSKDINEESDKTRKGTDKKSRKSKADSEDNNNNIKKKHGYKKGDKSKILDDNEEGENIKDKKVKGRKTRTSKYIDERIITNLREKVRKGDNVGLDTDTKDGRGKQFAEALQYRQLNSARADAVKACDYLRANMEQRELCQSVCKPQEYFLQSCLCNPRSCTPRSCLTCICPSTAYTLCHESYVK